MDEKIITKELEKVPEFTGTNVTKFLYQSLYIFETFSWKFSTREIVALLATKFKFEDFKMITKQKFVDFNDFSEFVIRLGKADVPKEDVVDEIKNMRQYRGESLLKYSCRISTLLVEYTLAVDADGGDSELTPEAFKSFLAESAIAGLDKKYRKTIPMEGLDLDQLFAFLKGEPEEKVRKVKFNIPEKRWIVKEKLKLSNRKLFSRFGRNQSLDIASSYEKPWNAQNLFYFVQKIFSIWKIF